MIENPIVLKSINDILKENPDLFIPSYQRGYRWIQQQGDNLLDDIWEFAVTKKPGEIYCLQPLVVKKSDNRWELIDGQQRLTTIFLILKFLESLIDGDNKNFRISFETRKDSEDYLNKIDESKADTNIDYHHIFNAYKNIKDWFNVKANKGSSGARVKFLDPFLEAYQSYLVRGR